VFENLQTQDTMLRQANSGLAVEPKESNWRAFVRVAFALKVCCDGVAVAIMTGISASAVSHDCYSRNSEPSITGIIRSKMIIPTPAADEFCKQLSAS
jgi:hypothetical protein